MQFRDTRTLRWRGMSFVALSRYPASPNFQPRRRSTGRRRGVGATTAQIAGSAVTSGFDIAGAALAMTGVGAPIGAIVAAVGSILGPIIASFNGCGATCTQASNLANQAEPLLEQAVATYMAAPVHYASTQAGTVAQIQAVFAALQTACSNPALGAAGQNCISGRLVRGACAYKVAPFGWAQDSTGKWTYTPAGSNGSGSVCWNWLVGYLDPVANDPTVVADPNPLTSVGSSVTSAFASLFGGGAATSSNLTPMLLIGGALLLLVVLL